MNPTDELDENENKIYTWHEQGKEWQKCMYLF